MSLFGDSSEDSIGRRTNTNNKSSLFADEATSGSKASGGGLFGDDGAEDDTGSPWNFTPKKHQTRDNTVKALLAGANVPEAYVDAFDALIEAGHVSGSGVSLEGVKNLLGSTGLTEQEQAHILKLVSPPGGQQIISSFDRGTFNVVVALMGLAQEEEDVTLDGVDERRNRLPIPSLPESKPKKTAAATSLSSREPPSPSQQRHQSESVPSAHKGQKPSFGFPEQDPWGSPVAVRTEHIEERQHANGETVVETHRSTTYSTGATTETHRTQASTANNSISADTWGGYGDSTVASLRDSTLSGGFGAPSDDAGELTLPRPNRPLREPRAAAHGLEEILQVVTVPEKEGPFMFQHRNYEIISQRKNTKIVRRYSDFAWLLDCLQKRYPFRQLPLLPPKRVAINGTHIAADATFIERRRRGLSRFVNALIRHPVLKDEQLVTMFLTVPTELSSWKKQVNVQEEFVGKTLPPTLEDSLPPTLEELFTTVRNGVQRSADTYIMMVNQLERIIKRQAGLAAEFSRLSTSVRSVAEYSQETYNIDTNDVALLNEGLVTSSKHLSQHQSLLDDESRSLDEGALEDYKRQRDALVSMRDMFDRKDRLSRDNIPQLEKRIASNENKLVGVRAKPEEARKKGEAEKLEQAIMADKESIVQQHARGVFIKECVRDEIKYWQSTQYDVSRMCQDFSQELVKYSELKADNWRVLSEQVESMPVGES